MKEPKTLLEAIQYFSDFENCRRFMIAMRWPDGIVRCPTCGKEGSAWLEKARVYYCSAKHPKQKFSLKVGTILEDSPIGLDKWFPAMWMLSNCKNGISSYELHRALGVTQKSAWFMLHRIRWAMRTQSFVKMGGPQGGPVEVDECYVGGKLKNMHATRRNKLKLGVYGDNKIAVMGMLDRETRQVRTRLLGEVTREELQKEILLQVEKGSTIYTDNHTGYDRLKTQEFVHDTVNHMQEYVCGQVHTNGIENFWSLLKRGLNGTYVAVEPFHLSKYVDEQAFRYNNRATKDNPLEDSDRFMLAVSQIAGKRLTYADLTGKVSGTEVF
jgi:transposase-like protein